MVNSNLQREQIIPSEKAYAYKMKYDAKNADYTVSYSNNINAGTATVTITGIGFYEGTTGTTFRITSRSIGEVTVGKMVKVLYFSGKLVQNFVQKIE